VKRAALALLVLALAGCGGGGKTTTNAVTTVALPTTTTAGDQGKGVIDALVAAARAHRTDAVWGMLSTTSKQRLGPTLAAFRRSAGPTLAPLAALGPYKEVVSERITPEFGVVAVDDGKEVYALPLRLEGSTWKAELGGPVTIKVLGPQPGSKGLVAQIGVGVGGPSGVGTAVMYLDGQTENPKVYTTATNSTLVSDFDPALPAGRHTVVVFATDGREAAAKAWWFRATKPKS
jgi:hypothetical protein